MTTGLSVQICRHCMEPVNEKDEHLEGSFWRCKHREIGAKCSCGHRIRGKNHCLGQHHNGSVPSNPRV